MFETDDCSTLHNAYAQLISSMMDTAQAHISLADSMNVEVIESLKVTERRQEEAKKKQEQYFAKLLSERDKVYSDRIKVHIARQCLRCMTDHVVRRASKRFNGQCNRAVLRIDVSPSMTKTVAK